MSEFRTRGIRGAVTTEANTPEAIKEATVELLSTIIRENELDLKETAFAIFTLTPDLDAAFPAKFAREELGFDLVPMMCYNELNVKNSIKMCIRVLLSVNTTKKQDEIKHVYLKEARKLRQDLIK